MNRLVDNDSQTTYDRWTVPLTDTTFIIIWLMLCNGRRLVRFRQRATGLGSGKEHGRGQKLRYVPGVS